VYVDAFLLENLINPDKYINEELEIGMEGIDILEKEQDM